MSRTDSHFVRENDRIREAVDIVPGVKVVPVEGHLPGSLVLLWKSHLFVADSVHVIPVGHFECLSRGSVIVLKEQEVRIVRYRSTGRYGLCCIYVELSR